MISVGDSRELQAVVLGLKAMSRDLRNEINRATTAELGPLWKSLVQVHASRHTDSLILAKGARLSGGNPPTLYAAQSSKALGAGKRLIPNRDYAGYEFGADRDAYSRYERRNRKAGGFHVVERRTMRGLRPRRRTGYVVYPAIQDFAPRLASMWVQLVMRRTYDTFEGKTR